MRVSTADLSAILGITDRHIQRLENEGVLRKTDYGEWDLAEAVQAYLGRLLKAKPRQSGGARQAEDRLKAVKAQREELKLANERSALIPTPEAVRIMEETIGILRTEFAGLGARITRDAGLGARLDAEVGAVIDGAAAVFTKWSARFEGVRNDDERFYRPAGADAAGGAGGAD